MVVGATGNNLIYRVAFCHIPIAEIANQIILVFNNRSRVKRSDSIDISFAIVIVVGATETSLHVATLIHRKGCYTAIYSEGFWVASEI